MKTHAIWHKPKEEALMRSASSQRIEERIYCALETLYLQGKAGERALSRAVYVIMFFSNKIKDKQENQVAHTTYKLIEAKIFMEATKWNIEKIDIIRW